MHSEVRLSLGVVRFSSGMETVRSWYGGVYGAQSLWARLSSTIGAYGALKRVGDGCLGIVACTDLKGYGVWLA